MDERAFYNEREEIKKIKLLCPSCRGEFEFPVRWKVCRKKKELPRGAGEEDKKRFAKASSYMVRLDDLVACSKCRKRFELTGQSTVLISDTLGDPNAAPENFGNRSLSNSLPTSNPGHQISGYISKKASIDSRKVASISSLLPSI